MVFGIDFNRKLTVTAKSLFKEAWKKEKEERRQVTEGPDANCGAVPSSRPQQDESRAFASYAPRALDCTSSEADTPKFGDVNSSIDIATEVSNAGNHVQSSRKKESSLFTPSTLSLLECASPTQALEARRCSKKRPTPDFRNILQTSLTPARTSARKSSREITPVGQASLPPRMDSDTAKCRALIEDTLRSKHRTRHWTTKLV